MVKIERRNFAALENRLNFVQTKIDENRYSSNAIAYAGEEARSLRWAMKIITAHFERYEEGIAEGCNR